MVVFEELQERIRVNIDIGRMAREVADILKRFEEEEVPVIYNQEEDRSYLRSGVQHRPEQERLLRRLGLADEKGKNDNQYDWKIVTLNEKARAIFLRLKEEGYYSEQK